MVNSTFFLKGELKLKLIIYSKYFFAYDWLKSDRMWDLMQIAMIPVRGGKVSAVLNVFHTPFIITLVVRNRHGLLPLLAKSWCSFEIV